MKHTIAALSGPTAVSSVTAQLQTLTNSCHLNTLSSNTAHSYNPAFKQFSSHANRGQVHKPQLYEYDPQTERVLGARVWSLHRGRATLCVVPLSVRVLLKKAPD